MEQPQSATATAAPLDGTTVMRTPQQPVEEPAATAAATQATPPLSDPTPPQQQLPSALQLEPPPVGTAAGAAGNKHLTPWKVREALYHMHAWLYIRCLKRQHVQPAVSPHPNLTQLHLYCCPCCCCPTALKVGSLRLASIIRNKQQQGASNAGQLEQQQGGGEVVARIRATAAG